MILDGIMRGLQSLTTPGESQWRWWRAQGFSGTPKPTASGVDVDEKTALTHTAVLRAISVLAETSSQLPLTLYRREADDQRTKAPDHPAQKLLDAPNPIMDGMTFRENMMTQLVGRGNAYAEKVWGIAPDGNYRPVMLWPIPAERVKPKLYPDRVEKYYEVSRPDGQQVILAQDEMLHLRGKGDALEGWSPIRLGAESIGAGIAETKYAAAQVGKGNTPPGLIKFARRPTDDVIAQFKSSWDKEHSGPENVGKVGFLWGEGDWINTSISNRDAQLIEQRQFTVLEICRIFGVPPHLLYDLTRATFSNIEQQSLEYLAYTLAYWLAKWSTALNAAMLLPTLYPTDANLYFEHVTAALVKTDLVTRFTAYEKARQWGWMDGNEIRAKENMPKRDDAGDLIVPSGSVRTRDLGKEPATAPMPKLQADDPVQPLREAVDAAKAVRRSWCAETMGRMVRKESLELARLAKTPGAFLDRVGEFYQRHRQTLREALAPLELGESPLIGLWCTGSFELALDAAGKATPAQLEAAIASLVADWPQRAEAFAKEAFP